MFLTDRQKLRTRKESPHTKGANPNFVLPHKEGVWVDFLFLSVVPLKPPEAGKSYKDNIRKKAKCMIMHMYIGPA